MGDEIIFYNGFNLLVDIIVGLLVFYFTRRYYSIESFFQGYDKALEHIDRGVMYKQECDGELKWTFNPEACECEDCIPTPNNVTQLFSSREAD